MKVLATAALLLAATLCSAAAQDAAKPADADPAKVVATVNGHNITESEMKLAEAEIGSELAGVPEESRRRVLVEYLVEAHLMAEAAEKAGLDKGDSFERRMAYHRLRALRDAFFEVKVRDDVKTDEAKTLYEERVKTLPKQEEVRARHILVKTEDEAKKVKTELEGGGNFAELAKKYSQDRGGADGGDLGYFTRGQMVKAFDEAAFTLEPNKISDPVQTEFGWHIIKVEDKRDRQPPSFDEVKEQITASLIQNKLQTAVQEMRKAAKIDIVDAELKKAVEQEEANPSGQAEDNAEESAEEAEPGEAEKKN